MLTVYHLDGALNGTKAEIDASKERVVFGRHVDCDVHFPPEATDIARHHFALMRRPSGAWTVELFGTPFVAINGAPADNGEAVKDGAKFELGRPGGPAFILGIKEDVRTDDFPRTNVQEAAPSARAVAQRATTLAQAARAVAAAAVALALGAGGVAAYNAISAHNTTARLDAAQKEFAGALAREANLRIGPEVRAHLGRAVYLVLLQDADRRLTPAGTAWVVDSNRLATNAHVAVLREGLRAGEKMLVVAPGQNGKMHDVVEHKLHPGYVLFSAFLQSDRRIFMKYRGGASELEGNGYDVALLTVSGALPQEARLELAAPGEFEALTAGSPLGTSGYPTEQIQGAWAQSIGATPEQHVGIVTAVTDMFHLPSEPAYRQLVHHDLPATGGQSGSPIVGASGRVVALLNSGNVFRDAKGGRMPSAALINYGQRVDLLRDLLAGTAEQKVAEARKRWQEVAAFFVQGKDVVPNVILSKSLPEAGMKPRLLAEITRNMVAKSGRFDSADGEGYYVNYMASPQKLAPGFDYLFLAITEDSNARLEVLVDGAMVGKASATNYPSVSCRLLWQSQQHSGDPKQPRTACATGHERVTGMLLPPDQAKLRDVEIVVGNVKTAGDALANADLKYTLRIYQWVPDGPRGPSASR